MEIMQENDHVLLLYRLKSVVQNMLDRHSNSAFGSLHSLHAIVLIIFKQGCRILKQNGEPDIWIFIQGLSWLQPTLAASPSFIGCHDKNQIRSPISTDKASVWIYRSLENHNLSEKLCWLLSDQEHIVSCYKSDSFLRQPRYSEATLICLRAVEQNQLSFLTDIDPSLYITSKNIRKTHRRSVSYPETNLIQKRLTEKEELIEKSDNRKLEQLIKTLESLDKNYKKDRKLKKCLSTGDLVIYSNLEKQLNVPIRRKYSNSLCSLKNESLSNIIKIDYNSRDRTDSISSSTDTLINKRTKRRRKRTFFKLPFRIWEESDDDEDTQTLVSDPVNIPKRKSFIESGGNNVLPMSLGFFPTPSPGQSLMSFLSSGAFSQFNGELDRENAHLTISDAMIAALEQVKCNQQLQRADEVMYESDEEINRMKENIRIRRRLKEHQKLYYSSSRMTDTTTTTDQSVNSSSSSHCSTSESVSTDNEDEGLRIANLSSMGLSVSKTSIYSDLSEKSEMSVTAECVGMSLIRRFKETQLPSASEIKWLVSERDAPQQILPMPTNLPIGMESADDTYQNTLLRGNTEWAPPRPQIIFTPHPPPIRRLFMEKQGYRCAGCGVKVDPKYASKFRYCDYLGRYFCTGCHSQQTAYIPGRIISKWDFTRCYVSNFSYNLLDEMYTDPLFNIIDLNATLYKKVRSLHKSRLLRMQLYHLKDFIHNCRYTDGLKSVLRKEERYIFTNPDCYSLRDLVLVKNGKFITNLTNIVRAAIKHVANCQLCQARGFICEICAKGKVIFPWEMNQVIRCDECGSCYHIKCFNIERTCPKCERINSRED